VEQRFCPNCGQENTETRKTFHHLFIHFFEDLTHYENAFWKTMRNLIFRPGSLTKVYLSGRRMSYLAPVRLYIFISFITFFIVAVLPDGADDGDMAHGDLVTVTSRDSLGVVHREKVRDTIDDKIAYGDMLPVKSLEELDSIQRGQKPGERYSGIEYYVMKRMLLVAKENTGSEAAEKFTEAFSRNLPKVLFIYMPFFALVLWFFQSKRRWYYFDHGIFTLHYFSFLLLAFLASEFFMCLSSLTTGFIGGFFGVFQVAIYIYMFYYFFPAHHRFYGETRFMSILKGIVMFFINSFLAGIIMLLFIVYTFLNIH
jgi:hypothetical protein